MKAHANVSPKNDTSPPQKHAPVHGKEKFQPSFRQSRLNKRVFEVEENESQSTQPDRPSAIRPRISEAADQLPIEKLREKAIECKIFEGYRLYASKSVTLEKEDMDTFMKAGGKTISRPPAKLDSTVIIICHENDLEMPSVKKLRTLEYTIFNPSVLRAFIQVQGLTVDK
eukprot:TRINITY_DN5184_c0_g1_i9.p1 TRINITY_DN5184_c0_g1~~TRINITY_DN5184_c0_g1_i9.p1  ORF type:complete len:170 (+),score=37.45 TRINITY_DN5184_c0_g1_i9:256-765(+)